MWKHRLGKYRNAKHMIRVMIGVNKEAPLYELSPENLGWGVWQASWKAFLIQNNILGLPYPFSDLPQNIGTLFQTRPYKETSSVCVLSIWEGHKPYPISDQYGLKSYPLPALTYIAYVAPLGRSAGRSVGHEIIGVPQKEVRESMAIPWVESDSNISYVKSSNLPQRM